MKQMRNMILLAKVQTAKGTPATLTGAANAILVRSTMPTPIKAEFVDRPLLMGIKGTSGALVVGEHRTIEIEVEMAGSGTAGTRPKYGDLFLGCGLAETVTAGTDVKYQPAATTQYLTLLANLDGIDFKLTDAIGTVSWDMSPKGIPVWKFTFMGVYEAMADASPPAGVVFTGFLKPLTVGKTNTPTFTLHGVSPCVSAFSGEIANALEWRELINCSGARSADRKPSASVKLELKDMATKNWAEVARLGDEGALQVIHGITAGNKVQIDAPKAQITAEPTLGEEGGLAMLDLKFSLNRNAGNDEVVFTFK